MRNHPDHATILRPIPSGGGGGREDIITVEEACRFLGIHRNTLYKLIQAREIPAFRLARGGRWKFRRSELEQWLEDKLARGFL
jgi:excisionase family DNA binding protein